MSKRYTSIPKRQRCVDKEEPYIGYSEDIFDDDLMLTQAQINDIVLGGALNVSLTPNKSAVFVNENTDITLTATMLNVRADRIVIKRGQTQIGTEEVNAYSCQRTDNVTPTGNLTYTAYFTKGGKTKEASRTISAVKPIYYGGGAAYTDITNNEHRASARTNPADTYNISLSTTTYIWFVIPSNMSNVRATMGPLEFPLDAPDTTSMEGYKIYRSSTPHGAGDYPITLITTA